MIRVHTPYETIISPIQISPERYDWLYDAHSRMAQPEAFTYNLLKLLTRYHPRTKPVNPKGCKLKLGSYWANPPLLQPVMKRTFLTKTELFGSPLTCSMTSGITYCSTFPKDEIFSVIIVSFLGRWIGSWYTSRRTCLEQFSMHSLPQGPHIPLY